ncbi:MAG: ATP-binding protein [Acidobacteria bacterium]|nr:ATP-binding protein [Acidobacteriota bacterium]
MRRPEPATQTSEFPRVLSALSELLDLLGEVFEQYNVDNRSAFWVTLAAEEVFTNMIRHNRSSDNRISMDLDITETRISVRLTDYGVPPFDPATVPEVDTTLSAEQRTPGGLGVFIVRSKMDDVTYSHQNGNLSVSFTKYRKLADD